MVDSEVSRDYDYDQAFELTGHGIFNNLVLICCSLIFLHSLLEMVATAYILDPALCEMNFSVSEKGLIGSSIFIGIVITSICWGSISDKLGRRRVMLPAIIGSVIASFGSSMCKSFIAMFCMRILTGALVSASSATVLVYLGELHILERRDRAISYAVSFVALAFIVIPGLAWLIVPRPWHIRLGSFTIKPWRMFMWSWGIVGLAGAIMLYLLPESPRFVLANKGPTKALPILAAIYARNHKKKPSDFMVSRLNGSDTALTEGQQGLIETLKTMSQLLKPPMLRCFILTHYCMFMVFMLANGFYIWMPGMFNQLLYDIHVPATTCDIVKHLKPEEEIKKLNLWWDTDPYAGGGGMDCKTGKINDVMYVLAVAMEVLFLIPFILITIYIDRIDKRKLFAAVMIPCSIFLALCVFVPQALISTTLVTIGLASGSCATILTALAVDAFPTSLRALAMCTLYMMGQVGAVIGNLLVSWGVEGPCEILFLVTAASTAGSSLCLLFLWPDLSKVRTKMEARGYTF